MIGDIIVEDLKNLGVRNNGPLLVHSSLRSIGSFPNRAQILIESLLKSLGPNGTLLLPSLSYETVTPNNPYFDINRTPSCVGALTEYFRKLGNTIRSVHPTHSVCGIGSLASELLASHINCTTPAGKDSPFFKLKEMKGQILFIGCGLKPNTSMHAIEELVEPSYLFSDYHEFQLTLLDGKQITSRIKCHNFKGWEQRYDRLENILVDSSLRKGKVAEADCYLVEADEMWAKAHEKLIEDSLYFVDKT